MIRATATAAIALGLALGGASGEARAAAAASSYTYDRVGRLVTARYDNGLCIVYAYDAVGNRTAQTNTTSGTPEAPTWGTGTWGCLNWTSAGGMMLRRPGRHPAKGAAAARQARP